MTDKKEPVQPSQVSRADLMFPTLSPSQLESVAAHGRSRPTQSGEVLFDVGHRIVPFLLVSSGVVAGRPSLVQIRAGSMKRVASAVGEGSTASLVHQVLHE